LSNDDPIKGPKTIRIPPLRDVLPDRMKKARRRHGISQNDLARRITASGSSISGPAIGLWEMGRGIPTADNLRRVAVILGVSADELLGINHIFKSKTSKEAELAERFLKLTDREQAVVSALIESMERIRPAKESK
jgi:transcriptional regulator with XRE-family HTH domain